MEELNLKNIFTLENIEAALEYILTRRNSCGTDGIYISDFKEYWEINGEHIVEEILTGKYVNSPVQVRELVMPTGKHRKIALHTCTDRLITRILSDSFQKKFDSSLSEYSYAYRKDKGSIQAIEQAAAYIQDGKTWVLEIDIENYFDNIDLARLENVLREWISDEMLISLIRQYLHCEVMEPEIAFCKKKEKGLIQGSSLSPVLSNLYLNKLDIELEESGLAFCRFCDNINIYFEDQTSALKWYEIIQNKLSDEFKLKINNKKSGIFMALNRTFLGYAFKQEKNGTVIVSRKTNKKAVWYSNWKTSALRYADREYHIVNNGILTRKDYTILFENEQGKRFLPVEVIDKLNIYSDVIFTSDFFEYVSKHNIDVAIYNKYGNFCGVFYGNKHAGSSNMIVKQVMLYNDEVKRLSVAKSIIMAAAHNMRSNIRYYYKKDKTQKEDIDRMSDFIKKMNEATSIQNLMLIEAQCRQCYYHYMGKIISSEEFPFVQRQKRPPTDQVNAMISFGNVFLYERIATEINKTALDIKVGFLHATNRRTASLNLDLAEIFKPIIVDRVIFTVIHKKIINASSHFEPFGDKGIYLNTEGKKIFISELKKKLYSKISLDQKEISYNEIIRQEVWKIYRLIDQGEKYKPYKYSN